MKLLKIITLITCCLILMVILFYLYHFYNSPISKSPERWGQLGDFFGGILNPIIAFFNLLVFIFLTLEIQKLNDTSEEKRLQIHKEITRSSFKNEIYREMREKIIDIEGEINKNEKVGYMNLQNYIQKTEIFYGHVFDIKNIKKSVDIIVDKCNVMIERQTLGTKITRDQTQEEIHQELKKIMTEIQKQIME